MSDCRRAAIVGAGPSGFFTAELLLKAGYQVDMLDRLVTPFGLVRFGVAPDHPKIKLVSRVFEKVAAMPGFRYFGGVELGVDVSRDDLRDHYPLVIYATGANESASLGIPGEHRPGSHSAARFVAWYNGHPDAADEAFDLSCKRAVVIGNGNVALDVARMLLLGADQLRQTDTADHAIAALARSGVHEVIVMGRRSASQAAFTNPELRELAELEGVEVVVDPADLPSDGQEPESPMQRMNLQTLREMAGAARTSAKRRLELRFLVSPVEIMGAGETGPVEGVRVVRNRLVRDGNGGCAVVRGDEEQVIECGLVLRAIGYRSDPVCAVPFDASRGIIRNVDGRVVDEAGAVQRGEYAVGWVKRGPSGIIGTNKKDAFETVEKIFADEAAGLLDFADGERSAAAADMIAGKTRDMVSWSGWEAIDRTEKAAGVPFGRDRIKLVRKADLLRAACQSLVGESPHNEDSAQSLPELGSSR